MRGWLGPPSMSRKEQAGRVRCKRSRKNGMGLLPQFPLDDAPEITIDFDHDGHNCPVVTAPTAMARELSTATRTRGGEHR